uniref:Transmembrane protein 182 n=1 Tax=Echeneis naucrates TaxID=173247 RepID=A0A665TBW0_ECHNA
KKISVLLFLALFFGAVGFLFMLLCCGTEYWLLAAESCSRPEEGRGVSRPTDQRSVRIFHEGLFWRCSFTVDMHFWKQNGFLKMFLLNFSPSVTQPSSRLCQTAFLFPFPVKGLRADIFLVSGVAAVVTGGFLVICAGPLSKHQLYKVGGTLQLCGGLCLLAVLLMYLIWVQVLDTLEQFALHQRVSSCPSFHLSVQHGPSFLLAPVAVFFCLLAGPLFILVGRKLHQ